MHLAWPALFVNALGASQLVQHIQASKFICQNNIMTILIQDVNNTIAGYQKEILPSSWSPVVKYSVF